VEIFSDTRMGTRVDQYCDRGTRDGYLSTCGNYKNNGCWCPIPSSCDSFSARLSYSLIMPEASDMRFFGSFDDFAEVRPL
jgi:hypothetical protein